MTQEEINEKLSPMLQMLRGLKPLIQTVLSYGGYVVFENPGYSTLWGTEEFRDIVRLQPDGFRAFRHDQCMYHDEDTPPSSVYKKPMEFVTNMPREWTVHLEQRCTHGSHVHPPCLGANHEGKPRTRGTMHYTPGQVEAW